MPDLRALPSVEKLLQTRTAAELVAAYGRPLTLQAIRTALNDIRARLSRGSAVTIPKHGRMLKKAQALLEDWTTPTLLPVINATGVILHTNLGRAPLSTATRQSMEVIGHGYSTLEFNLESGKRGSRLIHAEAVLKQLTGAEAAMVVNNNASAVLLTLSALARRRKVVIARSQLVEIGGGFRIPDVMKQSGAKLVEVGTTNKVHLEDYENALEEPTALVMLAHRSNFKIIGFTEEPALKEIVRVSHAAGVPVADDLGSGTFLDTERFGLVHERTVQESLAAEADVICFSGDKLLGGPQAGIIIGRAGLIAKIKKHPLARAVRADKVCLAGVTATLMHYLKDEALREIPIWRMISTALEHIEARAKNWVKSLGQGEVIPGKSAIGGGSLPGETLPTYLLALDVPSPDRFLAKLRAQQQPVIARTENDRVLLDPRTVLPEQDGALLVTLQNTLK
ncbi:MAG: L-seryl-tRNA(Sec) selenium transferase [Chloroflexi bacterium]|nr:L-seryl-tRNA(Sec) selenium transferase [Chloroflexota bacterium]